MASADPFMFDEIGRNAIFYASQQDSVKTDALLIELEDIIAKFRIG